MPAALPLDTLGACRAYHRALYGVPSAASAGSTFNIGISVAFTSGGNISNIAALSLWLWQASPGGNYPISITGRDLTGSFFANAGNPLFPQILDPINRNPNGGSADLGGLATNGSSYPSGTYFLGTYTFSIAPNALPGVYVIGNTISSIPNVGGRVSIFADPNGNSFPMADSRFSVAIVPEPGTSALFAVGALLGGTVLAQRRRARR